MGATEFWEDEGRFHISAERREGNIVETGKVRMAKGGKIGFKISVEWGGGVEGRRIGVRQNWKR